MANQKKLHLSWVYFFSLVMFPFRTGQKACHLMHTLPKVTKLLTTGFSLFACFSPIFWIWGVFYSVTLDGQGFCKSRIFWEIQTGGSQSSRLKPQKFPRKSGQTPSWRIGPFRGWLGPFQGLLEHLRGRSGPGPIPPHLGPRLLRFPRSLDSCICSAVSFFFCFSESCMNMIGSPMLWLYWSLKLCAC